MSERTPGPWDRRMPGMVTGPDGRDIANAYYHRFAYEANAEFIVRACNAHDDLVAALELIHDYHVVPIADFEERHGHNVGLEQVAEAARVAIAKAKPAQ